MNGTAQVSEDFEIKEAQEIKVLRFRAKLFIRAANNNVSPDQVFVHKYQSETVSGPRISCCLTTNHLAYILPFMLQFCFLSKPQLRTPGLRITHSEYEKCLNNEIVNFVWNEIYIICVMYLESS